MNIVILLFSLLLINSSFAQTFKLQASSNRADYQVCQENHNRILNKFIKQTDSQAARMIQGIYLESFEQIPEYKLDSYKEILNEIIVKRIFFTELSKQLNAQKMYLPGKPEHYSNIKFLNPEAITIDLGAQYEKALDEIINAKNIKVGKNYLKDLRNDLIKNILLGMVSSRFRKIGAGIFARIALNQTGRIASGQVIKTATLKFGSKLFISAGTGLLLDLLTFPLHGYRLPPETEWTDLLADNPETIIVPEWMSKAGIRDAPWMAHCCAIQRRTKLMEKALSSAILTDEADFKASVREVYEMKDKEETELDPYPRYNTTAIDNTYVHRPVIYQKSPGPTWLVKP